MAQFLHGIGKALGTPLNALTRGYYNDQQKGEARLDDWISPEERQRLIESQTGQSRMPVLSPPNLDLNAMTPEQLMQYWWERQQEFPQERI